MIHQIWIGPKAPPMHWISTWLPLNPKYTHKLWREKHIENLWVGYRKSPEMLRLRTMYDAFVRDGVYHGAADIARLLILKQHGGLYIDADTACLRALPDELTDCYFLAVRANPKKGVEAGRIANGIMGSVPEHPIILEYLKRMARAKVVRPPWKTIGAPMLRESIMTHTDEWALQFPGHDIRVDILPSWTFYPENSLGEPAEGAEKAYAKHYWGSTKNLYE
jgi:mannosyltransferase OCH1-like enzyme